MNETESTPSTFRVIAFTAAIAIIAVKAAAALSRIVVRTFYGIADTRSNTN